MKGWLVTDDEQLFYVLANTASKAKYAAFKHENELAGGLDWFEFRAQYRVTRQPEIDGATINGTSVMLLGRMFDECPGCGEMYYPTGPYDFDDQGYKKADPVFVSPGGGWFCSEQCWIDQGAPTRALADDRGRVLALYPE